MNNTKCVNCKFCIGTITEGSIYYMCNLGGVLEYIEECIANDPNMDCEAYVEDSDDEFTARS